MFLHRGAVLIALAITLILAASCSGGEQTPTSAVMPGSPEAGINRPLEGLQHGRVLWSYHLVYVDLEENITRLIPVRDAASHWNVLKFLERGPCEKCVQVAGLSVTSNLTLLIDLEVIHPFPIPNLTGFDVRGILMFDGDHLFPMSGLSAPDSSAGNGEVLNADGYTTLYNGATTGAGPGGFQGYLEGSFASPDSPDALLNGFKRYVSDDPGNTRNAFYAGESIAVTYEIAPPDGPFVFGYAVDASWEPPTTSPVTDPMSDFPPEANCPEPWKIKVIDTPVGDGLTPEGGETVLTIRVDDYQGKQSHSTPLVECPDLFSGAIIATYSEDGPGFSRWHATVENENLAPAGTYKCLISVEDDENDPTGKPWLDLTAYQIYLLEVHDGCIHNEPPVAAAQTHPSPAVIHPGEAVAFSDESTDPDGSGDIAKREWDFSFEEGDGFQSESEEEAPWHVYLEQGDYEVQLRVTDSCGQVDLLDTSLAVHVAHSGWARTWGGSDDDVGYSVAVDSLGDVYVTGEFRSAFDFDPGPQTDWHESNGEYDAFLCKYDSTGRFQWALTWGGIDNDKGWSVATDSSGDVYVTGTFNDTVDFDPGPGVDEHECIGTSWIGDTFLSRFDSAGAFQWARTWGGERDDTPGGVAVDGAGDIYVAGTFWGTVDFDPGPGVDEHAPVMNDGVFLTKFDPAGTHQWARTWGGTYSDYGHGIAVDTDNNIYVTGMFGFTVDFDPGDGVEERTSTDWWDVFLSKFNSSGTFLWVQTWGGGEWEQGTAVAAGGGAVYVTGFFWVPVDFDPGTGTDIHDTNGSRDVFLSKFDSDGAYQWVRTWGGGAWDESQALDADQYGNVHVAGFFTGTVDFDPGTGIVEHTSVGADDAFVSKLFPDGSLDWARTWGGTLDDSAWGVCLDGMGNVCVTGAFEGVGVDFDPGAEVDEHDSNGGTDAFVMKLLSNGYWEW